MKITIHRGINQIGGCITEIATETTKIFIDLGHNLPKGDKPVEDANASTEEIEELTKNCRAIFYSHYHGDHIDLYKYVPDNIPQYTGEIAKQVMICKSKRLAKLPEKTNVTEKDVEKLESFKTFKAKDKIEIGDIYVTPYFVSHSACDSYMFLVESNGKSILHTGDFREHGYLGKGLFPTIETYIAKRGIDVLITEGTMLSRLQEKVKHENDLKIEAIELLKKYKYAFVLCSSTDIDRLASFYEASKQNGKRLLCDGYQQEIFDIFTANTPFKFDNAQFYKHGKENQFEVIKNKGFCMLLRSSKTKILKELLECLSAEEILLIYSMWDGYINENVKNGENLVQSYLDIWNLFENKQKIHTSGHATAETLTKVCQLVNPKMAIIPIHSEHSADIFKLDISDSLKEKIIITQTFQF